MMTLESEYSRATKQLNQIIKTTRGRTGLNALHRMGSCRLVLVASTVGLLHNTDLEMQDVSDLLVPLASLVRRNCAIFHFIDELISYEVEVCGLSREETSMMETARNHLSRYLSRACWRTASLKKAPTPVANFYPCCEPLRMSQAQPRVAYAA